MAILRVKDEEGNVQEIVAIKGDKGDKGDVSLEQLEELRSYVDEAIANIDVNVDNTEINNRIDGLVDIIGTLEQQISRIDEIGATTETLESQMGDVDTALDSIIAIQNGLIGGGSE